MSAVRYVVLYAYFENPRSKTALEFFLDHGVVEKPDVQYILITNGNACSLDIPTGSAFASLNRENSGNDFAAWSHGLSTLSDVLARRGTTLASDARYVFLNDTVTGPFLPRYIDPVAMPWYRWFTALLSDTVKISGPTINSHCLKRTTDTGEEIVIPSIQSMAFCLDQIGLDILIKHGIMLASPGEYAATFRGGKGKRDYVIKYELGMSKVIYEAGYTADALFTVLRPVGQIWGKGRYHRGEVHPFETIFVKTTLPYSIMVHVLREAAKAPASS
jgi:hypothetical protein